MSKTGWIILGICLCVAFCICAGLILAGRIAGFFLNGQKDTSVSSSTTKDYKDLNNDFSADGLYSLQMKELKKLNIDWISGSVTIELTDEDRIRIREISDSGIKEKDALRYGVNGGTLRIQACKKGYVGKLPIKKLIVSLPRSLAADLKECEIDTVSASVMTGNLDLDELEIDTISGQVNLSDTVAEEAQVETVSGTVSLVDCAFASLRLESVSGAAKIIGTAKKVKASSVSGELDFSLKSCKEIKVNTISGSIILDLSDAPKELKIDTTSGSMQLTLPKDASCVIDLDAMSGKLYLNEEAIASKKVTLGDGAAEYSIDSMSGSVHVFTK